MKYCPNCGAEIYLSDKIKKVKYIYCESCGRKSSVRDHGEIRAGELKMKRRSYMRKHIDQQEIKTSRSVPANKLSKAYK